MPGRVDTSSFHVSPDACGVGRPVRHFQSWQSSRRLPRLTRSSAWNAPASRRGSPGAALPTCARTWSSLTASARACRSASQTWRDHGYRIHVMTGVSWGGYQDYLYGRFDGVNHEDEAQTGPRRPQDQPRRRRLLHVSRHELRQVPLRGSAARARCGRRGDPPGGAGVLGRAAAIRRVSSASGAVTMARSGSRRTAPWTPSGAPPSSSIISTGAPSSRCLITCRITTARTGRHVRCYVPTPQPA